MKTAIMLRRSSETRFAGYEGVLEAFVRAKYVLPELCKHKDYFEVFGGKKNRSKAELFKKTIEEGNGFFFKKVEKVFQIIHILRNYLRCFDRDDAKISEVLPATDNTRVLLSLIPECDFLTAKMKADVDEVFKVRRDGLSKREKVRLVNDIHYTAYFLDPNLCPLEYDHYMPAFGRHATIYARSNNVQEKDIKSVVSKLKLDFNCIFEIWRK